MSIEEPIIHIELTEDDDKDFEPHTFVAYCDHCDAIIAWRTLMPVSDWFCINDSSEKITHVVNPHDVSCVSCGANTWLPTLKSLLREPKFQEHLRRVSFQV